MADDDEEQVLGVLARCEVCGEKTLHVDGVCQDHKIVRRRRKPPQVSPPRELGALETRRARLAAERAADEAAAAARKGSHWGRRLILMLLLGGLIWLMGATHILHGDRSGIAFCWKAGWTLSDTLVDTDRPEPPPAKVIEALANCAY